MQPLSNRTPYLTLPSETPLTFNTLSLVVQTAESIATLVSDGDGFRFASLMSGRRTHVLAGTVTTARELSCPETKQLIELTCTAVCVIGMLYLLLAVYTHVVSGRKGVKILKLHVFLSAARAH